MKFFDNMKYRMQQWSYGRYGFDELSRFLYIVGFVLILLSFIPHCGFLILLSFALFIYVTFRSFSRNTAKRKRENDWYLRKTSPIRESREREADSSKRSASSTTSSNARNAETSTGCLEGRGR